MLSSQDPGGIYLELFKSYTTRFNWVYRDLYPETEIKQPFFLYTLFLLPSFGDQQRHQQFYEDIFMTAFPMAIEMFEETGCSTAASSARQCYVIRALDRFAAFFWFGGEL